MENKTSFRNPNASFFYSQRFTVPNLSLQDLHLSCSGTGDTVYILRNVFESAHWPALQCLTVDCRDVCTTGNSLGISQFLSRHPKLHALAFIGPNFTVALPEQPHESLRYLFILNAQLVDIPSTSTYAMIQELLLLTIHRHPFCSQGMGRPLSAQVQKFYLKKESFCILVRIDIGAETLQRKYSNIYIHIP